MKVSIVTPSLNQGLYIRATIDSVLSQGYPELDYVVLDGGSTAETLDILRSYGSGLSWRSEPDAGQADAINRGFATAGGELIGWLNADDVYLPGAIAALVDAAAEDPDRALIYGGAEFIDAAGRPLGPCTQVRPYSREALLNELDFIVQPATLFSRSAFEAVGGLDASLRYCFDYDLWLKLSERYPVAYLARTLAQVRLHATTKTSTGGLARLDEIERMVGRHGRSRIPSGFYGQMARARRDAAWVALRGWRLGEAFRQLGSGASYVWAHLLGAVRRRRTSSG